MNDYILEQAKKRTERYWYEDGIWEIAFGVANIFLAGSLILLQRLLARGTINALGQMVLEFVLIVAIFRLINVLVKKLKEKITYPRTGYVAYRRPPLHSRWRRRAQIALISAGVAALVGAAAALRTSVSLAPIATGTVFAGMLIYLGSRFNLLRLYALVPPVIVLGLGVAAARLEDTLGMAAFFGGLGLLLMLSGGAALALYLRRTRPAADSAGYEAPEHPMED